MKTKAEIFGWGLEKEMLEALKESEQKIRHLCETVNRFSKALGLGHKVHVDDWTDDIKNVIIKAEIAHTPIGNSLESQEGREGSNMRSTKDRLYLCKRLADATATDLLYAGREYMGSETQSEHLVRTVFDALKVKGYKIVKRQAGEVCP